MIMTGRAVDGSAGDLADGTWDGRHGAVRAQRRFEGSLVLIRAGSGSGNGHTV